MGRTRLIDEVLFKVINLKKTTSTAVKARYNSKAYQRFEFNVRKDSKLHENILNFKETNPQKFSALTKSLLEDYFEKH